MVDALHLGQGCHLISPLLLASANFIGRACHMSFSEKYSSKTREIWAQNVALAWQISVIRDQHQNTYPPLRQQLLSWLLARQHKAEHYHGSTCSLSRRDQSVNMWCVCLRVRQSSLVLTLSPHTMFFSHVMLWNAIPWWYAFAVSHEHRSSSPERPKNLPHILARFTYRTEQHRANFFFFLFFVFHRGALECDSIRFCNPLTWKLHVSHIPEKSDSRVFEAKTRPKKKKEKKRKLHTK